jgi:hypothetical protein
VELGDKVVTTDTKTGKKTVREVAGTIVTEDDKSFSDLTVKTASGKVQALVATTTHPFWVTSEQAWIKAGDLEPGMTLHTPSGDTVEVEANRHFEKRQRTHDLTITGIHAYYVLANSTPLLAHNCDDDLGDTVREQSAASSTSNHAAAVARDGYTGEVRYGESGAVPGNVAPELAPRLREAQEMQARGGGDNLEEWDPGTCAEFHACNNLMNDTGARLDEIDYYTITRGDGQPFESCGWCKQILGGGGARDRTRG